MKPHSQHQNQGSLFNTYSGATLSECREYRYLLWRIWDFSKPIATFIGLNPSTADEYEDDNTIRRCIGFAHEWDCGGIRMMNLYAFRATKPADLWKAPDPVGKLNNQYLKHYAARTNKLIFAWGAFPKAQNRIDEVMKLLPGAMHLGLTKEGFPRHPLYLKAGTKPQPFEK